ncbi:MAG: flippase-like domain-containing protein [Rhodospirillaceae bacterium]|nr:flippase-like domain-containing protein [Rhodospirillaceae bacterium]
MASDADLRQGVATALDGGVGWLWQPILAAFWVVGLRAWRLAVVLGRPMGLAMVRLSALHQTANLLLPLKLGELALPLLIRRDGARGFAGGLGALVAIRLWDLAVLGVAAAWALAVAAPQVAPGVAGLVWAAGAIGVLAVAAGVAAAPRLSVWLAGRHGDGAGHGVAARLWAVAHGAFAHDRAMLLGILATTAGAWLAVFAGFHLVAANIGATPGFAASALGAIASSLAFALPINGVGTIGPAQIAYAAAMALFGVPFEAALATALVWHAAAVATTVAVAAPWLPTLLAQRPRQGV